MQRRGEEKESSAHGAIIDRSMGVAYLLGILVVLAFVASMATGVLSIPEDEGTVRVKPVTFTTAVRFHPERFLLNGLLAPSLDADVVPLRWVDPRPAMLCGPRASVRVDGEPLVPGTLVPGGPFELQWHADGCGPFGAAGPRFDGEVTLTVFREDWGFSAIVTPRDLRVTMPSYRSRTVHAGVATMPQFAPEDELPGE
jgi:hypothetical protein